jgi:hypothetical protein
MVLQAAARNQESGCCTPLDSRKLKQSLVLLNTNIHVQEVNTNKQNKFLVKET